MFDLGKVSKRKYHENLVNLVKEVIRVKKQSNQGLHPLQFYLLFV